MDTTGFDIDSLLEVPSRRRGARKKAKIEQRKVSRGVKGPRNLQPPAPAKPQPVNFAPKTRGQAEWKAALSSNRLVFGDGPAGTGKTLFAVARAVQLLCDGEIERIILTRPAVEADEKLGFLPGNIREKLDPYLRPLYDAMEEVLGGVGSNAVATIAGWEKSKVIEIAPLGLIRGRTFKNAAVVLDEAQNATYGQLKMALTRIGEGSYMFVTGDPAQSDLPEGKSGLSAILDKVREDFPVVALKNRDVVRDPIVAKLVGLL